jgi:putative peptidoglycan lipid II flippase
VLEVGLLAGSTARLGELPRLARIAWDADVKRFFAALGPAIIGSGGVQLAMFADTIIASFLPAGAISALYYADRLNQLPIGVIGIAVGTVLLPEMSRRIAAGDEDGARQAQSRAIEFTLLLSLPCLVAFLIVPDLIMRALFARGAFTAADAAAAGATLAAYALGLVPVVLIRSMVAMFFARGDTATPVKAAVTAVPVNIAFKILLMGPLAQVGLALATTIGAWINFALVLWFGARAGYLRRDRALARAIAKLAVAGAALALVLWLGRAPALDLFADAGRWRDLSGLVLLAAAGGAVYAGIVLALFGRQWLAQLRRRRAGAGEAKPLPDPLVPLE